MSEWETHWLSDCEYFVRCRAEMSPAFLNFQPSCIGMVFEAFEGVGWQCSDGPSGWPNDVAYVVLQKNYRGSGDDIPVEDLDNAHRSVYGKVRWDATGHIYFGEARDEGYYYCGDLQDTQKISLLLEHVWRIAWEFYLHESAGGQAEDFIVERRG